MDIPDLFAGTVQRGDSIIPRLPNGEAKFDKPNARSTDPGTSHAAARSVKPSPGRLAAMLCLTRGPMTDFELAAATGLQQTSIGKRRHECMGAGLVRARTTIDGDTVTRPAPSGSRATVWEITGAGAAWLFEHRDE
jgi:hypothetical protein